MSLTILTVNAIVCILGLFFWIFCLIIAKGDDYEMKSAEEIAMKFLPEVKEAPERFYVKYGYRKVLVAEKKEFLNSIFEKLDEEKDKLNKLFAEMRCVKYESEDSKKLDQAIEETEHKIANMRKVVNDYMDRALNLYAIIYSSGKVERL